LTVVKKRQAVPPRGAAFFFVLQGFDKFGRVSGLRGRERFCGTAKKGHFSHGGFMSAFRFDLLLNVSII
jgi:hypothetical protein